MKYNTLINLKRLTIMLIVSGGLCMACDDSNSIEVSTINENGFTTSTDVLAYTSDKEGKRSTSLVELRQESSTVLYLDLSKNAPQNVNGTFKYDKAVLDAYNATNASSYQLFPEALVNLSESGAITIEKGSKKSKGVSVSIKANESLEEGVTYVIPISASTQSGDVKLSSKASNFLIFVKDYSKLPNSEKSTGIKIISCMEVNDTNPLNNLCFTLKNSGKPLVDILILFSANINYNAETGKVYVFNNPNVQHLLDNRLKYLKPLQDRGMKIVLGILGNHDRAGVANLADETARAFAQELKGVCDAYKLDGVFFDDEYSKFITPPPPGFVTNSSAAASRLCYEVKQAMPDRLVCAYAYSTTFRLPDIDGKTSGQFVDYGIHDYGGSSDLSTNYPGMPKSGMALYSQEFSQGRIASEANLKRMRDNGYGANMIFAMDPFRSNFQNSQKVAMERVARALFDDELVYDGKPYKKDW